MQTQETDVRTLGENPDILEYIGCFSAIAGTHAYDADVYHSLSANGWQTIFVLSDPEFETEVLPSLEADVINVVVPENSRMAIRHALKRAPRMLAAKLRTVNMAAGVAPLDAAAMFTGGDGAASASASSTSHTSGESAGQPKAKSGAMTFYTRDGEPLTVQKTAGAIDRIRANQHWLRIWSKDRRNFFLGDNYEFEPDEMMDKLDVIAESLVTGFAPEGDDWGSMDRLRELRLLRVTKCPRKFSRLVAFEWHALYPLRLSITDFLQLNTAVDSLDEKSISEATRSALQRALQGLALALHVLVGTPVEFFEAAFGSMMVALQGEKSAHIPDIMLIHGINAAVARTMVRFKHESPPEANSKVFTADNALIHALDSAMKTSVLRLPSPRDTLEFGKFEREILTILRKNALLGESTDSDSSDSPGRSRKRGSRGSKGKKRGATDSSGSSADGKKKNPGGSSTGATTGQAGGEKQGRVGIRTRPRPNLRPGRTWTPVPTSWPAYWAARRRMTPRRSSTARTSAGAIGVATPSSTR